MQKGKISVTEERRNENSPNTVRRYLNLRDISQIKFLVIRRNAALKQSTVCSHAGAYFGCYTVSTECIPTSV